MSHQISPIPRYVSSLLDIIMISPSSQTLQGGEERHKRIRRDYPSMLVPGRSNCVARTPRNRP